MLHSLAKNWWALALRGLVAVLFGLLTFLLPGITLATLVLLFGAYALVDGIFNVIAFFKVASHQWALLIEGVIGIIAGVLTFAWPAITAFVLLYLIAFWALFTGVFEIIATIRLRKAISNEWLLLLMGVLVAVRIVHPVCPRNRSIGHRIVDRGICVDFRSLLDGLSVSSARASALNDAADMISRVARKHTNCFPHEV
jgi:uncharacterized membrane protein HdeD (DUF308 family)